jgi:hypothetical protein
MVQFCGNKLQNGGPPPETQALDGLHGGRASASRYFGKALVFDAEPLLFVFGNENTIFQFDPGS